MSRVAVGHSLRQLAEIAGAELRGDPEIVVDRVSTLTDAERGAISFLANSRYRSYLSGTRASAVILAAEDAPDCPVPCLIAENPDLARARVMTALYPAPVPEPGVHPTAFVDPSARIAPSAVIAASCFIGPNVEIAEDVQIGPGCVLLDNVIIGTGSRLVGSVTLCADTQLGQRCLIHPGAVIGSDGFGLANDEGVWEKMPQVGRAVLGDDVEVGSCTSIDRGAIGDTSINDGVKIDSQVHIAHNVQIGEHTAIAGCSAVAGSSRVGRYCTIAGGAGITGHVELTDRVHISGASAVTRSIKKPGAYTGTVPAMEHATWLKNFARLRQLDDMVRRVRALEQELAVLRARDQTRD